LTMFKLFDYLGQALLIVLAIAATAFIIYIIFKVATTAILQAKKDFETRNKP